MADADIKLLFGVLGGGDISGESGKQIKDDLENIVKNINNDPLPIKFKVDDSFAKELAKMAADIEKINKASQNGSKANVLKKDTQKYYESLSKVENKIKSLEASKQKYKNSTDSASQTEISQIDDQIAALERLKSKVETGFLTVRRFNKDFAKIGSEAASTGSGLEKASNAFKDQKKLIEDANNTYKEYYKTLKQVEANSDVKQDASGTYYSESQQFTKLADQMNEAAKAKKALDYELKHNPSGNYTSDSITK